MALCQNCEAPLEGAKKLWCSERCRAVHTKRTKVHLLPEHLCQQCMIAFTPKDKRQKFCSHSCSATYFNALRAKPKLPCQHCGTPLRQNRIRLVFCSWKCRQDAALQKWLAGEVPGSEWGQLPKYAKEYLYSLRGRLCWECGWNQVHPVTGNIPVEIDHIDGNPTNNALENLRVLCPNCHSLTPTFRNLNPRGRKRKASNNGPLVNAESRDLLTVE